MVIKVTRNMPTGEKLRLALKVAKLRSLQTIGVLLEEDTKKRFEEQGPDWKPLKPATVKAKGSSAILIDTGLLVNSIENQVDEDNGTVRLGVFKKERALIALVHELGSPSRKIPSRPFMVPTFIKHEQEALEIVKASYKLVIEGI